MTVRVHEVRCAEPGRSQAAVQNLLMAESLAMDERPQECSISDTDSEQLLLGQAGPTGCSSTEVNRGSEGVCLDGSTCLMADEQGKWHTSSQTSLHTDRHRQSTAPSWAVHPGRALTAFPSPV